MLHRCVVGDVTTKCGTTWMTEMRGKGKFLGMKAVRGQDQERRVLEGVVRDGGRARRALCQKQEERV